MNRLIYSILLIAILCQTELISQGIMEMYPEETLNALENRTENEKKVSTSLFCSIFKHNKALSEGASKMSAMEYFPAEWFMRDENQRIRILIRFYKGYAGGTEEVKSLINSSGGMVISERIGHNECQEICAWLPIDKIIALTVNENVGLIEDILLPVFRYTSAGYEQLKS